MSQINDVLGRLNKVTPAGNGKWSACCPAHEDQNPSLSVSLGDGDKILVHCHAGCTQEAVLAALDVNGKWVGPVPKSTSCDVDSKTARVAGFTTKADATASILRMEPGAKVTTYDYTPHFSIVRLDYARGKTFRPICRNGKGGWALHDPPGKLPLYNLDGVRDADPLWICEGERCVDEAKRLGLTATTSSHGSKSALRTDWTPLSGKSCIILPDNDDAGARYANDVAGALSELNCKVKIVALPGLPGGGDICDWVEAHDSTDDDDLVRMLEGIADRVEWNHLPDIGKMEGPVYRCFADITPKPLTWFWPNRIPAGKLSLIAGVGDIGKSFITIDLAGRKSRGTGWPDNPKQPTEPCNVVFMTCEDGIEDTIANRLAATNVDLSRIYHLDGVRRSKDAELDQFAFESDLEHLDTMIRDIGDVGLVVVDPLSAFLGPGVESFKDSEVRRVLGPVARMADRLSVTILGIMHVGKANVPGNAAVMRILGSVAFCNAARAIWMAFEDPSHPDKRLLLPGKANLSPRRPTGLAYQIREPGYVEWFADPVDLTADDVMSGKGTKRAECEDLIRDLLKDGPADINKAVREAGFGDSTIHNAKRRLKVVCEAVRGYGGTIESWTWRLP